MIVTRSRFPLGHLVATPGAMIAFEQSHEAIKTYLTRHAMCDWGDLDEEDRRENDYALTRRLRLLSAYRLRSGTRIWIITEADRSATIVLTPQEY